MEEDAVEPMTYFQEKLKNIVQQKKIKKNLSGWHSALIQ